MAIVAGVDFGTLSVRVSLLDSQSGRLSTASSAYPLHRRREDPDFATQSHDDQMEALVNATREAIQKAGIDGNDVVALARPPARSSQD
jgi:L-ribulokinase